LYISHIPKTNQWLIDVAQLMITDLINQHPEELGLLKDYETYQKVK